MISHWVGEFDDKFEIVPLVHLKKKKKTVWPSVESPVVLVINIASHLKSEEEICLKLFILHRLLRQFS